MKRIKDYTVVDLEMTGLAVKLDRIIEIGAVRVRGGDVADTYAPGFRFHRELQN